MQRLETNLNFISSLADQPAMSTAELKQEFDKAGNVIKDFINNTMIRELDDIVTNEIQGLRTSILNEAFPVGFTVVFTDNQDHSNHLGFNWERCYEGRTVVGYKEGDADFGTIGALGGNKEITLSTANLPPHSHKYTKTDVQFAHEYDRTFRGIGASNASYTETNTSVTGEGKAINIMNPYEVVAYWRRIS